MSRCVLPLLIAALGVGCYGPDQTSTTETETSSSGGLAESSGSSTGGTSGLNSTGLVDETGTPPTSTSSGGTGETTGDCSVGVFGRSVFGNACFQ